MMNRKARNCPQCNTPLPHDAPRGLCPECLLRGGLENAGEGDFHDRTAPIRAPLDEPGGGVPETLRRFGDYELIEQLAVGGMGVVFKARQASLNRLVAVKMIRAGQLARAEDIRRFRTEAEAVANLKHPHIVAIHEVGEQEGQPFFSMDFIAGQSLAELARERPLEPARAARLVQTVAEAIAYAHGRGVLHRDLKPSNVMIDAEGQPHVTDFGLAKIVSNTKHETRNTEQTVTGAVLGSPSYMSPEQARGRADQISVRSDVYALGAILYELLATRPPFLAATALETMKLVAEREPVAPRTLNPSVPRDLETVCLKCLQKEPAHRYVSADALAEDLARWQRHEPIQARPSTAWERGVKWARRHPARAALVGSSLVTPAAIIAVLLVTSARVTHERNQAVQQEHRATNALARVEEEARRADTAHAESQINLYAADMLLAQHAIEEGNLNSARGHVLQWKPARAGVTTNALGINSSAAETEESWLTDADALSTDVDALLRRDSWFPLWQRMTAQPLVPAASAQQAADDPRGFEWRLLWQRCQGDEEHTFHGHSNGVGCVAFSHDGKLLASGDANGQVIFWNTRYRRTSGRPLVTGSSLLVRISFSPDDQALSTTDHRGRTKVWNLATRKAVWSEQGRNQESPQLAAAGNLIGVSHDAFIPDPKRTNYIAEVIDWKTGKQVLSVAGGGFATFTADGRQAIVEFGRPPRAELWDLATRLMTRRITNFAGAITPSPDGRYLAGIGVSDTNGFSNVSIVDLLESKPALWVRLRGGVARRAAFSPDSALLAIAGGDQSVRLWDMIAQQEKPPLVGHSATVTDVAWSPDGHWLATASADRTVKLWSATRRRRSGDKFQSTGKCATRFLASPDGRTLAASHVYGGLWCFDLATREFLTLSPEPTLEAEFFSADSRWLFARGPLDANGVLPLLRWDLSAPAKPPQTSWLHLPTTNAVHNVAVSPDRSLYALEQHTSSFISLWNPITGEAAGQLRAPPHEWAGGPLCFSPDGQRLVTTVWPATIRLIEMAAPERQRTARLPARINHAVFSPDGKTLAVSCVDYRIHVFDGQTLKELAAMPGHQYEVGPLTWSPDGRTLASAGGDVVKLWCMAARREVATVARGNGGSINTLGFTPDGNALWAGAWGGQIHLWRVPTLAELDRPRP